MLEGQDDPVVVDLRPSLGVKNVGPAILSVNGMANAGVSCYQSS